MARFRDYSISRRRDIHKVEVTDEYGNVRLVQKRPLRLLAGLTINKVRVLHINRRRSELYDVEVLPGVRKRGRHWHIEDPVKCLCLACHKLFDVTSNRLHPNRPELSIWSCGCERRPQGLGWRALRSIEEGRQMRTREYGTHLDLTGQTFDQVEAFAWVTGKGWLCLCHHCNNTDGFFVRYSRMLTSGKVRACPVCSPILRRKVEEIRRVTSDRAVAFHRRTEAETEQLKALINLKAPWRTPEPDDDPFDGGPD